MSDEHCSPVIDLSAFYCRECCAFSCCDHLADCAVSEARRLSSAMERLGYFMVDCDCESLSHAIGDIRSAQIQLHTVCEEFFHQSPLDKMRAASKDRAKRGFSPVATENFASLVGVGSKPNDTVEKFRVGPPVDLASRAEEDVYFASKAARVHFFPNDWLALSAEFRDVSVAYYEMMSKLAVILLQIIERSFNLRKGFLTEENDKHTSILSYNFFPSLPNQKRQQQPELVERIAEHTDVSMLTIVTELGEENSSNDVHLELFNSAEEKWERVRHRPGRLLVNVGDCLSERSRLRLKSALHRVVMDSNEGESKERLSTAFFFSPNYNAQMRWEEESDPTVENAIDYDTWRKNRVKRAMDELKKGSTSETTAKPPSKKKSSK